MEIHEERLSSFWGKLKNGLKLVLCTLLWKNGGGQAKRLECAAWKGSTDGKAIECWRVKSNSKPKSNIIERNSFK